MLNIRNIFFLIILTLVTGSVFAQNTGISARNGWYITPRGNFHILVIFAEINFDSTFGKYDPTPKAGMAGWKSGEMPTWKDELFDPAPNGAGKGYMSRYFQQASFGEFQVTGDYVDQVITVNLSDIKNPAGNVVLQEPFGNNYYRRAVIDKVNEMGTLKTKNRQAKENFDHWTLTGAGKANLHEPNERYDMVMIIFRNIHVRNLGDGSGFVQPGSVGDLFGMGSDMYSIFRSGNSIPDIIMRHEFSHMLYGGNNFHTATAGVGTRTFMGSIGGWSNMSNADRCSPTWNAWDRYTMGWKHPDSPGLISCIDPNTGAYISGDLEYGKPFGSKTQVIKLRDFATTGDVVRIKLPHIPANQENQYVWLENHQRKPGIIDHDGVMAKGLYAYIQVGKDYQESPQAFGGFNNYTWPLVAAGHYDFGYSADTLYWDTHRENPFTGYHYLMRPPYDLNRDGTITMAVDMGNKSEYFWIAHLIKDGRPLEKEYFNYMEYTIFGTKEIAFTRWGNNKIGISENPAAVPLYSHQSPGKSPRDNRTVWLNGISIEIIEEDGEGNLYLKIRWDDFDIDQDKRWTGNIHVKEEVNVLAGKAITFEQGMSPQLTKKVYTLDGEAVFAEPTVFVIDSGAVVRLGAGASLDFREGSSFVIRKGGRLEMDKNSSVTIDELSFILIEEGAVIDRHKKAKLAIHGEEGRVNPLVRVW